MSIGLRIKQFIDYKKISFREFDKKSSIGNGYSKKIINGENSPSVNIVDNIIQGFPDLNKNWLLTGEGEMIKKDFWSEIEVRFSLLIDLLKIDEKEFYSSINYEYILNNNINEEIITKTLKTYKNVSKNWILNGIEPIYKYSKTLYIEDFLNELKIDKETFFKGIKINNHNIYDLKSDLYTLTNLFEKIYDTYSIDIYSYINNFYYPLDNLSIFSEPQENYGKPKPNTLKTKGVPIYNVEFNAGLLPLSTEYVHFDEFIIGYCDFPEVQGADLITKMRGNSMTGVLENGDWISFRKLNSLSVINYGHIFGIITNDKVPLIKYVRKGPTDDILILKSHNPAFDDIELPKSEILAMFMVIDKVQITALAN